MAKRGSVTVFLALILSLMLSLVCTSVESARMAAARTQILSSVDIGLYSLFGQYDKALLKDYDLFFLDGSCGGETLNLAKIYDNMEAYLKPVLKQNSQKLSLEQGGFSGYRLATDHSGEVLFHQAVRYMKETLGSQGVQLLLQKIQGNERKTKDAEEAGKQAETGNTLENYEAEMDAAARNSEAALEAERKQQEEEFTGGPDGGGSSQEEAVEKPEAAKVVNPIPILRRIRKMGILELVIPGGKGVSDASVAKSSLVSGRSLQKGLDMPGSAKEDNSYTSRLLFQQYLMNKLGNYQNPAGKGLRYQIEYLLQGKTSDMENLKAIAGKLLLIREGVNMAHLLSDSGKRAQVQALALGIASAFLIPPASAVIEGALLLCWAFAESVLDVRELFDGGKVPLIKTSADWQLSLENLPNLLQGLDSERKGTENGMSYEEYLQTLLVLEGKVRMVQRGMDMIEESVRKQTGRENFRLDSCIEALEASVDVKANHKKVFTVTKQYCYS